MFQTSIPVTADNFHNRVAELEMLRGAIQRLKRGAPSWVAVIGPRKIGKTSLVLEAARRSAADELTVVALDVQEVTPLSVDFFRRLALRVLDATLGQELGESLERMAHTPSDFRRRLQESPLFARLPVGLRAEILEVPEGETNSARAAMWLGFPEALAKALDRRMIVAIDEFQELGALASQRKGFDPFTLMRSVWQKQERCAYFVSGSARSMLLALLTAEHSPFFQHFTVMDLGPFGRDDAVALLAQHSPPEFPIKRELAERAVEVLGGHPFYLQMLGETLTSRGRGPDLEDLKAALQELLFSRTGRLGLYFENEYSRLVGRATSLAAVLDALAAGPLRLGEIATQIRAASGATVRYIERLQDAVHHCEDGSYALLDPTFSMWLRWRKPGGTVVPMTLVGDEAEQAVAAALAEMGFDLVYQSRASRGAFDLLAIRGSVQLGVQVKRSDLPLRFPRTAWSRMQAEAARHRWEWVVAAVGRDGRVSILDPAHAIVAVAARLDEKAKVDNLLLWLDRPNART
jgi:AAA+ ATPase superfamily predicted ATPase